MAAISTPNATPLRAPIIQYGLAGFTVALVLAPLVPILWQSVRDKPLYDAGGAITAGNYARLLTDHAFLGAIGNSLLFAAVTTIMALVVGVAAAIAVGRTDMPGRGLIGEVMLWPLYVSHLVLAFGFAIMFGPSGYVTLAVKTATDVEPWSLYSVLGMGIVSGVAQAPLTYLMCLSAVQLADPALEDAARITGAGPFRSLVSVTLPLLRPAILYSTILNFTVALELLAIPLIFGNPVGLEFLTTYLYNQGVGASTPDYGVVGAASVLLLLLVTFLLWLQNKLLENAQRFVTLGGKASRPRRLQLGPWRWVSTLVMLLYLALFVVLPLIGLVLRAVTSFLSPLMPISEVLTLDHVTQILTSPNYVRSILNTIVLSIGGGAIATLFVGMVAVIVHRSEFRFGRGLEFIATYPRAVPGLIAGIGFLWAMLVFPPLAVLHNTIWILLLAYMMRYLPTGFAAISPMLLQIGRDLDRSARSVGADWWTTCRAILLPLIKPALFSCFAVMFVHFFKEYAAAVFLIAPGSEVIGTTLLSFWIQGDAGPVAALATLQVLITFAFIFGARLLLGVKVYG